MAYLEIRDLCKHFTKRSGGWLSSRKETIRAVDGVSLTIEKGEILGLVGESGCGKSTLSRTLMQLIPPTSGTFILDGEDLSLLSPREIRKRRLDFQMVFQDPYASLNPRMTVYSTLAEAIRQRHPGSKGRALTERIETLMATVGLDAQMMRKYPHEFSGGQRQRIAIARALITRPKLIVADEPVSALDVSVQAQVLNLLADLQQQFGVTYLFISHDLAVIDHVCDEVAVMHAGQIVEHGPTEQVLQRPAHEYTRTLLDAVPRLQPRSARVDSAAPPAGAI